MNWKVERLEFYVIVGTLAAIMFAGFIEAGLAIKSSAAVEHAASVAQRDDLLSEISALKDRIVTDEFDISDISVRRAELKLQVDGLTDKIEALQKQLTHTPVIGTSQFPPVPSYTRPPALQYNTPPQFSTIPDSATDAIVLALACRAEKWSKDVSVIWRGVSISCDQLKAAGVDKMLPPEGK